MARSSVVKNYFGFNKGKITEANGLTFPENSMRDELNIDINYDGTVQRRRGLDYEAGYQKVDTISNIATKATSSYLWENAGDSGVSNFIVVRVGNKLSFFNSDTGAVSSNLIGTCDFSSLATDATLSAQEDMQFVSATGRLFCVNRYTEVFYVEWDGSTTFSPTQITIQIRDLDGIDDGLEINERPLSLSTEHKYNLVNQGWPDKSGNVRDAPDHSYYTYLLSGYKDRVGRYPANSEYYQGGISGAHRDGFRYYPDPARLEVPSTSEATKGFFILDAFYKDRSSVSGIGTIPVESTTERPTTIGFYQGHLLFGGVKTAEYKNAIFVSQSLTSIENAGKCYSVNDPTTDIESSPLNTDGGTLQVQGLGSPLSIKSSANKCVIIGNSGVWSIRSADDGIFSVNNVVIEKVTSAGGVGSSTAVEYENSVFYWSDDGIYSISPDQTGLNMVATNLTEFTIQTDYLAISDLQKRYCTVSSDTSNRKIYWLYNSQLQDTNGFTRSYDRALILDLRTGSFYDYLISSLDADSPLMCGIVFKKDISASEEDFNVLIGADTVVVGADDVVVSQVIYSSTDTPRLKVLTLVPDGSDYNITFSEFNNRSLVDWETEDGTGKSYSTYIKTGYEIVGDAMRDKQATYIYCYFKRTETSFVDNGSGGAVFDYPSSCLMRGVWDWTLTDTANRWSDPQQVYRFRVPYISGGIGEDFDYSYDVIETKNKLRGRGKSLSISFESEDFKDFQLVGWAIEYTAEGKV